MKDEAKKLLTKIVGDYDEKLAETERAEEAKHAAQAAFPARFVTLKREVIQPAVQEIADMLTERGHKATVREQEESSSTEGGVKSAALTLRVVPKPFAQKPTESNSIAIEITFSANRGERKVVVSSTTTMTTHGGTVGKRGEYELDAMTSDVVTSHVIQTLGEALGGKR
jgi:hypothetical protein